MTIRSTVALRSTEGSDAWKRHCARTSRVAKRGRVAENEQQWEHVVEDAHTSGRPLFVTGPPGTGKSFVVDKCVRKCLREGGRVLYALPTAQQASRVRTKHPEADVDTCSGAFFLYKNAIEVMDCLQQYDLVAVDEISQLAQEDFERIIQMWEAADKVPALVFAGDFWQLPGVNPSRATDSPRWKVVHKFELYEMFRCKDEVLKQKLNVLRTSTPTKQQLNTITRGHKAWSGHKEPTAWDLQQLYRNHPNTTIATCTRRAAALVNDLSIWVLFATRRQKELASVPVDWEANAENYDQERSGCCGKCGVVDVSIQGCQSVQTHIVKCCVRNMFSKGIVSYRPTKACDCTSRAMSTKRQTSSMGWNAWWRRTSRNPSACT